MSQERINDFLKVFESRVTDHDAWRITIAAFLDDLLSNDQQLLAALLVRHARREFERLDDNGSTSIPEQFTRIMNDLDIEFARCEYVLNPTE